MIGRLVKCEDRLALVIKQKIHRTYYMTFKVQFIDNGETVWSNLQGLEVLCK